MLAIIKLKLLRPKKNASPSKQLNKEAANVIKCLRDKSYEWTFYVASGRVLVSWYTVPTFYKFGFKTISVLYSESSEGARRARNFSRCAEKNDAAFPFPYLFLSTAGQLAERRPLHCSFAYNKGKSAMTENYPSGEKHAKSSDRNSMNTTHHCQGKSTRHRPVSSRYMN